MTASLAIDDPVLAEFALEIGDAGPVAVRGAGTCWELGGPIRPDCRIVAAPVGIVEHIPDEMIVTVRAGTPVADLHAALAAHRQTTALPERGGTVGGALAVGHSGLHRLGRGHVRDTLLQARYVSAQGSLATVGGPTVKNVTGFDVCRLLVGSLGTVGAIGEVILRTRPVPPAAAWLSATGVDPTGVARRIMASAILWDGTHTWVHLEGHASDVDEQATMLAAELGFVHGDGPPLLPPHRRSLSPADAAGLRPDRDGAFVVEIGVGTVHVPDPVAPAPPDPGVVALHRRVRSAYDPDGRFAPGRDPLQRP